jgi:hypothetical protein
MVPLLTVIFTLKQDGKQWVVCSRQLADWGYLCICLRQLAGCRRVDEIWKYEVETLNLRRQA